MLNKENYNDLYAFLMVTREGSFTRAAGKLGVSQSALSHTVRGLEERLGMLTQQYPDVNIELTANSGMVDIVAERFDAGVRFGNRVADGMIAVRIGPDVKMAVVATPQYFEQHGFPQIPQELTQHNCIGFRLTTQGGIYAWEFVKDGMEFKIRIGGQWVFNESYHTLDALRAGLGVGYIPEDMVREDLVSGRLLRALEPYSIGFQGYHLYYPHRRQQSPALKLVIDCLRLYREIL